LEREERAGGAADLLPKGMNSKLTEEWYLFHERELRKTVKMRNSQGRGINKNRE
jgi:hypothetical protein